MANFVTLAEMWTTLSSMNERLTPYSSKIEYQRYLNSLQHYKKILNAHVSRANEELDISINKSYRIVNSFIKADINNIKTQIENGNR
jgi:hypothetical protein